VLADLQKALLRALIDNDPLPALKREAASLSPEDRALVERIDPDGFALSALIVKKLRFERLTRGSDAVDAWFNRDPAGFAEVFKRYNAEVPPEEYFPAGEIVAFKAWCGRSGLELDGTRKAGPASNAP
jgi:uncharacterized protein YeaO (DUF488 family)